jgi:serine/threonine protein phosphatase PrpC
MELEGASLSHIGQVRQRNEDAVGFMDPRDPGVRKTKGSIFVVADGMGGHRGGEIASQMAVDAVISGYYVSTADDPSAALAEALRAANRAIVKKARSDVSLYGMGTTCTALVVRRKEAFVGHVGDSRAYLMRDGTLRQLTEDHSLVGEMMRQGILSDDEARTHPRRNVITRSIGTHEELDIDTPSSPLAIREGDVFLLCSDGLTSLVAEKDLQAGLSSKTPRAACDSLVDLANENGGKDNVTVVVVRILDAG